jgi:hypothetical protein
VNRSHLFLIAPTVGRQVLPREPGPKGRNAAEPRKKKKAKGKSEKPDVDIPAQKTRNYVMALRFPISTRREAAFGEILSSFP